RHRRRSSAEDSEPPHDSAHDEPLERATPRGVARSSGSAARRSSRAWSAGTRGCEPGSEPRGRADLEVLSDDAWIVGIARQVGSTAELGRAEDGLLRAGAEAAPDPAVGLAPDAVLVGD